MSKLLILFTVRLNTDLLTSITKRLESQTSAKLASVLGKVLGSAIYNNLNFLVDYGSSALETLLILSSFASMSSIRSLFRLHRRSLKMKPRTEITSESGQVSQRWRSIMLQMRYMITSPQGMNTNVLRVASKWKMSIKRDQTIWHSTNTWRYCKRERKIRFIFWLNR